MSGEVTKSPSESIRTSVDRHYRTPATAVRTFPTGTPVRLVFRPVTVSSDPPTGDSVENPRHGPLKRLGPEARFGPSLNKMAQNNRT